MSPVANFRREPLDAARFFRASNNPADARESTPCRGSCSRRRAPGLLGRAQSRWLCLPRCRKRDCRSRNHCRCRSEGLRGGCLGWLDNCYRWCNYLCRLCKYCSRILAERSLEWREWRPEKGLKTDTGLPWLGFWWWLNCVIVLVQAFNEDIDKICLFDLVVGLWQLFQSSPTGQQSNSFCSSLLHSSLFVQYFI